MKEKKEGPSHSHSELHDPKLPVIHGTHALGQLEQQIHSAPIPQPPHEL